MELADLLAPAQVRSLGSIASKKRALEELSKLLVEVAPDLSATDVLTSLVNREKLGSTAPDARAGQAGRCLRPFGVGHRL